MRSKMTPAQVVELGEQLLIDRRYNEGAALLRDAVEQFPSHPDVHLLLGTFLVDGDPESAVEHLAQAVKLDVNHPVRLTRAAGRLLALGYVDAAASYVARAMDLTPDGFVLEAEAINVSGLVAAAKGHEELAEEALRKAMSLDRSNEFFVRDFARFLVQCGRTAEAIAALDDAVSHVREPETLRLLRSEIAG